MGKFFKRVALAAFTMAMLGIASPSAVAQDAADSPLLFSFQTNVYGYQGPNNMITFSLGSTEAGVEVFVKSPKSTEYVDVKPWGIGTGSDGSHEVVASNVTVSVTETNNTVEVYGDPSKIDYIDLHGCYLSGATFSDDLVNLIVVDLSHNEITKIDLSRLYSLESIDLLDNQFTVPQNMKIGTQHPNLQILQVGINDVCDPELDLKNFPQLQYFSARNNYGITEVDPSGCPELVSLVLEITNISSLDVSKNLKLDVLNISNTRILDIDISMLTNLGEFYASHEGTYNSSYKLTSIDVSKNTKLQYLDLGGNRLTSLDVTNNPNLILLFLMRNQLSELDLSNCKKLAIVDISNNLFTYATLPLPQPGWQYFYYRSPLSCDLKYVENTPIDFSKEVIRAPYVDSTGATVTPETYASVFVAPRAQSAYALDDSKYKFEDGVLTIFEAIPDSVYVEFFCTAFPDWQLRSSSFMVKTQEEYDLPSIVFSFTPTTEMLGKEIAFSMGAVSQHESATLPADVVLLVDGQTFTVENAVTSSQLPQSSNVKFTMPSSISDGGSREVKVCLPDGLGVRSLALTNVPLTSIDLTQSGAESITNLNLDGAGLYAINLGYNNSLLSLNLSNNNLTRLDLAGIRGDYEKWNLSTLNVSHNQLTQINLVHYESLSDLDISYNKFNGYDFMYYTGLKNFNISNNGYAGKLDLSRQATLVNLDISNNQIDQLAVGSWNNIRSLNVTNNNLSFATLPVLNGSGLNYSYAPQNKFNIISKSAAINLSDQNLNNNTTFVWKYADNNQPLEASVYTCEGGATKFDPSIVDKVVYCEMTNPAFPAFDNAPLTTTNLTVADKPTIVVAEFTTATATNGKIGFIFSNRNMAQAVYIDWRGDGSEYEPYEYTATQIGDPAYLYRPAKTFAGATAKVYTYDSADAISVFAMDSIPLTNFDGRAMTKLNGLLLHNAKLTDGNIQIPTQSLTELVLDGNNFETQTFPGTRVSNLILANNKYKSFDASIYPNVVFLQISDNQIESIKFGNNKSLFQLMMTNNKLKSIDLTGLTGLEELGLIDNELSTIDMTPVKNNLHALQLEGNNFTFETLPKYWEMNPNTFTYYTYANQKPITVECVDGKVDLSSQAEIGANGIYTPTEFRWFIGNKQSDVYYDPYYETFIGEQLEGPEISDDPEYVIENGVTSFLYEQKSKVICAMTNEDLPSLILYTTPTAITAVSGVEQIDAEEAFGSIVDVYTLDGVRVRNQVPVEEAINGLTPGIYIIGGKKVLVK